MHVVAVRQSAQRLKHMHHLHATIRNVASNATRAMRNVHQGNAFRPTRPCIVALAIIDVRSFPMALPHVIMESALSYVNLVIFSKITNAYPVVLVALETLLIAISTAVDVAKRLKIAITTELLALQLPQIYLSNNPISPHCRYSLNLSHPHNPRASEAAGSLPITMAKFPNCHCRPATARANAPICSSRR